MKKIIIVLLIISGITLIFVALSIRTFPQWLAIPGGILILVGVAFDAVLGAGSKIKDWVELLFGKEEKNDPATSPSAKTGTTIFAEKIEHLEIHNTTEPLANSKTADNILELSQDDTPLSVEEAEYIETPFPKEYIPWILLSREEAKYIKDIVLKEWELLVNDKNVETKKYVTYLSDHAGLFFRSAGELKFVISRLELSKNNVVDLVETDDKASLGFSYELIKLVSPHVAPYGKSGPTNELMEAINKVNLWKAWLQDNIDESRWLFPSKNFIIFGKPLFEFTIYIGKRTSSKRWLTRRNELANEQNIRIRSFDALTERLVNEHLYFAAHSASTERKRLSLIARNELANPFTQAFSGRIWREILEHPKFNNQYHMLAENAEIILTKRRLNKFYKEYMSVWKNLSDEKKESIVDGFRRWGIEG